MRVATCDVDAATNACNNPAQFKLGAGVLEFVATFTGEASQHAGYGQTLGIACGGPSSEPFAMFSTKAGGSLKVRTCIGANAPELENDLGTSFAGVVGPLLGAPHVFHIARQANSVVYSVDGVVVQTHPVSDRGADAADSGQRLLGQQRQGRRGLDADLALRRQRHIPIARVRCLSSSQLGQRPLGRHHPGGTSIAIDVRTGTTATPDGTNWSAFLPIPSSPFALNRQARYIQYRAVLTSADASRTPELRDLIISSSNAANSVPVAHPDSFTVNEDTSLEVPAALGVLGNDTDVENGSLTARMVSPPSHGNLAFNVNGSFSYTPAPDFAGSDLFTYVANDGVTDSIEANVQIVVNQVNDAPSFVNGTNRTVLEDSGAQTVAGWATLMSAGPADESTQTLSVIVSNGNPSLFAVQPTIAANGTLTYTPTANANGSATVTVQLRDNGGTAGGGIDTSPAQTFRSRWPR